MNWIVDNRQSLSSFLPEFILIGGALITLLVGAFAPNARKMAFVISTLILVGYLSVSVTLLCPSIAGPLFSVRRGLGKRP